MGFGRDVLLEKSCEADTLRSEIVLREVFSNCNNRAGSRNRTDDLLITSQLIFGCFRDSTARRRLATFDKNKWHEIARFSVTICDWKCLLVRHATSVDPETKR